MDERQVLAAVCQLIESEFVGVLATVDQQGAPYTRLMGAVLEEADQPHRLYSLSGHDTHKIEQIRHCSKVCWLFHSPDHGKVVQLLGQAALHATSQLPESVWDKLSDSTQPYAKNTVRDDAHYAFDVIESRIEQVALLGRDFDLVTPRVIEL